MDHDYKYVDTKPIVGIPCNLFTASKTIETDVFKTTYEIEYYWNGM